MKEIKEIYLWIAFFALVIIGSVYLRYYYQPTLSLSVSFAPYSGQTFYPYQQVSAPIIVQNTGSSLISNLTFGLYVNGNLTRTYKMTIPSGKSVNVNFNFTPSSNGTYAVALIADPNNLYNIQNRNLAQAKLVVNITKPEKAEPQVVFGRNGLIGEDAYNMSSQGYGFAFFLFNSTGANQFSLTQSPLINNLIYPAMSVYSGYVKSIALAHATYKNYSMVSIWLKGYLTPSAIATAAIGKGFNVTTSGNLTVVNFGNRTTTCTWYSNGWLKTLGVINSSSCVKFVGTYNYNSVNSISSSNFGYKNLSIYNYSGYYKNYSYTGAWSLLNNSFLFQSVEKGNNFTNVCYGQIMTLNNISYCNTYYIEPHNTIMVKTNALIGPYNFSTWALTGNIVLTNQTKYDINLIKKYNVSGPSATFVSGYVNACYINSNIGCYGTYWNYTELGIGLINQYNSSVYLKSVACFGTGTPKYTILNKTLGPGGYTYITLPCYDNGTALSGVPLGLQVYLNLNYVALNKSVIAYGDAQLLR